MHKCGSQLMTLSSIYVIMENASSICFYGKCFLYLCRYVKPFLRFVNPTLDLSIHALDGVTHTLDL